MISPRNLNKPSMATRRMRSKTCWGGYGEARWLLTLFEFVVTNSNYKESIHVLYISLKIHFKGWVKKKNIVFMVRSWLRDRGLDEIPHLGLIQVVELTDVEEAPCCRRPVLRCVWWRPSRETWNMPLWCLSYEFHSGIPYFMLCVLFFSAPR